MKEIQQFKQKHWDTEYNKVSDTIQAFDVEGNLIDELSDGEWHITDYCNGYEEETNELNPEDRTTVKLTGEDFVKYYGGLESAYKII